jgi:hypothetical protein
MTRRVFLEGLTVEGGPNPGRSGARFESVSDWATAAMQKDREVRGSDQSPVISDQQRTLKKQREKNLVTCH